MQTTSQLYKNIIADPTHTFDVKLNIAGVDYEQEDILDLITDSKVWQQSPTIGGVYSSTCEFSILSDGASIPRMAKVIPYFRARTESQESEWIKKGEFYIDTRETIENGSGIKIFKAHCFDAILKTNAMYTESSISWPAVDISAINEICTAVGLTQDSRNASILNKGYTVGFPLKQTYRDVLSYIAVMYGANWIITDDGKLRIIPITGNADTIVIGQSVVDLRLSPKRPAYSKVYITVSNEDAFIKGNSDENVMEAYCPSATQTIANRIYSTLSAWQYQPFEAVGAWTDPSIEVGDKATILSITTPVYSRRISFGSGMVMELSAPNDDYIDHEYSYESPNDRRYKQTVDGLQREIVATATSLSSTIRQVENIQAQVDNAIETFTGAAVPTLNNYPANEWSTDTQKDTHIGDLYVVNSEGGDYEGFYYRFEKVNNAYQWRLLKDSEVTKALAEAEEALRRVGAAETAIEQNAQAITLRATKTEAQQYASTAQTNAINAAASDATSKANRAKTDAVSEANTATDQKLTNYSTTTEMNSAIEVSANAITQTVAETYTTKLEFENLEIGGENLLPDSDAPTLAATYKPNGATTSNSRYFSGTKPAAGTYTLEWIPLPSDIPAPPISVKHCAHYVYPNTTTNSLLNGIAWRDRYVPMVAGETYTMSAWFYVKSGSLNVQFQYGNGTYTWEYSDMSEGSVWERRSWTFVANASYITADSGDIKAWTRPYMGCGYKKGIAAEAYVCGFKMEIGNRATAWGPDTDDIIYKMESHETQIEQNSREIALRATKTELENLGDNLGGRITDAEAELSIQADQIASKVSTTDYNGNNIASLINQNSTTVQISASHVDLQGAVTVSAFDPTTQGLLVKNVTTKNQYAKSASKTTAPAESSSDWQDTIPVYDATKKYIWTRVVSTKTYTNDMSTTTYSVATCDENLAKAIEDAAIAQAEIDSLEIGGTNLLPDSNAPSFTKVSGTVNRYLSDPTQSAYVTGEFVEITNPPVPGIKNGYKLSCIEESTTVSQRGYAWRETETLISLVPGEEYTLSCYVRKLSGNPKINQRYAYLSGSTWKFPVSVLISEGIEVTWTEWQKISWTFTYNPTATTTHPRIYAVQLANYSLGEIETCGFKLEKGNMTTAWSPAPIDSEYAISISVKGADVEYYKSTSPTSLDDGQWQTTTPTWEDGYYIWTRTKWTQNDGSISFSTPSCITGNTGAKGDKGDAGTASTVYYLQSSDNAIVKNQAGTLSPASITFSAKSKTGTSNPANYSGRFKISESTNGSSWTAKYTSSSDEASKAYTPSANTVKFIKCDLYLAGGTTTLVDTQTVPVVADGANGTNGTDGEDAYTVILTNENHTFAGSTTAAIASSTVCNIIAYKGGTQVAATIGSITGAPTGMTVTPSGSGTTNASFTVAVTTSMITKNGVLTVPVTVDGKTFNMKFTYSLALKGNDGKGVRTITNYYAVNNSTTAPADSAFSTTVAAPTATDRYLWNYELLTYTDDSTAKTNKHIMAVYGEKGNTGKGISSITEYYAVNNSTTAPADSSFNTTVQTMTESNKYLWNYENVTYTDSTTEKTAKRIIGVYGTHGDTGKGIISVTELYYCSSSSTVPSAPSATVTVNDPTKYNQWNKACPEWTSTYKYYYTCSEVKYTDNTYTWTNVSVNNGYTTANAAASAAQTAADNAQSIAETTAANSPVINLLPMIYWSEYTNGTQYTSSGIEWTINKDGSVTAKGTATANSHCLLCGPTLTNDVPVITLDPSKRYYLSGCPSGGSSTTYRMGIRTTPEGTEPTSTSGAAQYDYGNGVLATANRKYAYVYCSIMKNFVCPEEGITFYPLFETGSVKHSYVSSRGGMVGLTKNTVKSTVSCYYRSTADTAPTIDTRTTIGTATNTDNTWSYILLNPKKNTYFYTCERYTYMDGSISFSSVRRMGNLSVTAQWCSANDQTLFDGANIYTGSVTADAIAANSIFTQKLTATDFTITGGSIQINTNNSTYDALILNYQGAQGLLTTKIQPGSVQVSSATTSVHLDADGIRFTENNKTTGWIPATGLMFMDIDLTDQDIPPSHGSEMYKQAICDVLNARSAETPVGSFVLLRIKHKTISSDPKYTGQVEYEVWGAQKGSNADRSYHIDSPTGDNPYTMYLNTGKAATLLENPTYYNQIFYVHGAWRTDSTLKVYD